MLDSVEQFVVSQRVVAFTEESLREAGDQGFERFVIWTGTLDQQRFVVRHAHVPPQTARKTRQGLSVHVHGEALHKLNVWLYENQQLLGAQVHAHPTDAFHSDTDDSFPIVTTLGGLSLVVPDFCRAGLLAGAAAFRLRSDGWVEDERPVEKLVAVA
jgi:hypothetical protein